MYHPSRAGFAEAAARGNLIPVYREIVADGDTPVSAYAKLGRGPYSFLLESVVGGEKWAAYSFIGVGPRAVIRVAAGRATITWYDPDEADTRSDGDAGDGDGDAGDGAGRAVRVEHRDVGDPTEAIADVLGRFTPVASPGLPRFFGGAVGWIGYDVVRAFERLPARTAPGLDVPDVCMVVTDTVVIFDNLRKTVKVVATPHVPDGADAARIDAIYNRACARVDDAIARLRAPTAPLGPMLPPPVGEAGTAALRWGGESPTSTVTEAAFCDAVSRAREHIRAGDIFQVVLSQRLAVPRGDLDLFDVYRALRVINPSPYMFHLAFPEAEVTGASPETLVRSAGGRVEVRPIAGTRPRGADDADDERLADELRADPKELAEHLMLIDLGRNDVGRVARLGSVRVSELRVIERYSHVMHMVSHVVGELRDGLIWRDVLRAAFPAGTLSGAPKIRAMEIIEDLEPHRRGVYGGAVGYVSYTGNLDTAIAIRTVVGVGESIYVQAGAGIVFDSDPATEYEETLNKARGMLRALALAREARAEDE